MTQDRRAFLKLTALGAASLLPTFSCSHRGAPDAVSDLERRFLAAAQAGDLRTVRTELAAHPALLGATDAQERSAFALAHLHGYRQVGDHLVAQGYLADAHEAALARDWERFTALTEQEVSNVDRDHPIGGTTMYAAAVGGAGSDIWRVYAATAGPNVLPRGDQGVSPLQAALSYRELPVAEMTAAALLSNHADPNPPSRAQDSPLHIAARRGLAEMVEMLIRHGARVDAEDRSGRTPAEAAEQAGHRQIVALLARHRSIPRTHSTSRTAYDASGRGYSPPDVRDIPLVERGRFVGQSHGNLDYVRQAVAAEPRMAHSVATTGEICVEACAHTGRQDVVDFLLDQGAPYALPTAVMRGDLTRVEALLDEDPLRIHERGAHDFALLWYPVIGGTSLEMMRLLLARGAEVEQQHFLGTTALHWACLHGLIEMVEMLLEHGADLNRRGRKFDAAGETPLKLAKARDHHEIARLLSQRGATV